MNKERTKKEQRKNKERTKNEQRMKSKNEVKEQQGTKNEDKKQRNKSWMKERANNSFTTTKNDYRRMLSECQEFTCN